MPFGKSNETAGSGFQRWARVWDAVVPEMGGIGKTQREGGIVKGCDLDVVRVDGGVASWGVHMHRGSAGEPDGRMERPESMPSLEFQIAYSYGGRGCMLCALVLKIRVPIIAYSEIRSIDVRQLGAA